MEVEQPLFIDVIIKLLICRAYTNNKLRKPLTADRCLTEASRLINRISEQRGDYRNIFDRNRNDRSLLRSMR